MDNWNKFIETYDIKYLKGLPFNLIKNNLDKISKFKSLYRIGELYLSQEDIKCDVLINILSLSYHVSDKYNKRIYIFGEHHRPDEKCSIESKNKCDVYDFIMYNITKIPKMIDIFLELPIHDKSYIDDPFLQHDEISGLGKFANHVKNCLDIGKEFCQYPNIRFHNTDIRQIKIEPVPFIFQFQKKFMKLVHLLSTYTENDFLEYQNVREEITNFLDKKKTRENKFFNITTHEQLLEYLMSIYSKFKLQKQIDHINNDNVKNILIKFLFNTVSKIDLKSLSYKYITDFIWKLGPEDEHPTQKTLDSVSNFYENVLSYITTPFMDVYLLARMFRKFKNVKYQNSNEPENIIIYVGDIHANTYREILSKLDFKEKFIQKSKSNEYCININKLQTPLFI